jgi:hypothetical protein
LRRKYLGVDPYPHARLEEDDIAQRRFVENILPAVVHVLGSGSGNAEEMRFGVENICVCVFCCCSAAVPDWPVGGSTQ